MCFLLPPGEGALCSIPIENILAVERLEEESFKMKNVRNPQVNPYEKSFEYLVQKYSHKYIDCSLTSCPFFPLADVPGHSTRASTLHPGQQLCRGPRLDRHPDQSQPVQPQTLKHLSSFSLPQWPLALLQALSWHSPWVYALHRVCKVVRMCPASQHFCLLSHSSVCICFQRSPSKHPAGRRWRQRDWEDLFPVQHVHEQTDQDARSDNGRSVC